jgi:ankyrin repeat protein
MVEMLLRAKYDVNAPPGNLDLTALQLAAKFGHLEILERFLIAGAGVNAPVAGHGGFTALQAAALNGHLNVSRGVVTCITTLKNP